MSEITSFPSNITSSSSVMKKITMMDQSFVPWVLGSLVFWVLLDYIRISFRKGLRTLPGPTLARYTGLYRLSMVFKGNAPICYRKVHDEYGKIVRIGPNHVSVSDSSAIPTIYGIGSKFTKTEFYNTMSPFYKGEKMDSMFTTQDPVFHKSFKNPVAQLFSMTNMRNYETYADECTDIFINAMKDLEGQSLDLGTWLQWYAFDVVACITFQRRFGFLEERKDVNKMIEALHDALGYVKVIGQFPAWHPYLVGNRRLMAWLKKNFPLNDPLESFMTITEEEIEKYQQQEKDKSGRTDFLAQLRAKEAKVGKISERDIVNHLSNNIFAGSDTTAISLRACFYYIMKTPRVYKKLIEEIDTADRNGQFSSHITYEQCLKLPYLQAVMKEGMRIHPGVGFPLERYVPPGGAKICGIDLPAGTNISVSAPVIHTNKDIWGEDADQFRPERWIDADPEYLKVMDRNFLAFGYGARTCIGKNISIMEMGKLVPTIFRHFDLEWASPDPEWKTDTAWFWKQSGIIVKFRSRHRA